MANVRRGKERAGDGGLPAIGGGNTTSKLGLNASKLKVAVPGTAPPKEHSWEAVLGVPMQQAVPGTCVLVAITVCLEANHRRKYESIHGQGTFPLQAADPSKLRRECFHDRYWDPVYGRKKMTRTWDRKQGFAIIARVLDMLIKMGGAPTTTLTTTKSLPLTGWEAFFHDWTLTPRLAARLIHERGPCVGLIFITDEYYQIEGEMVYRGCPSSLRRSLLKDGAGGGFHAVVCYQYRHKDGELQIRVLDNHSATGPRRWIAFCEFYSMYVLRVATLKLCHKTHSTRASADDWGASMQSCSQEPWIGSDDVTWIDVRYK